MQRVSHMLGFKPAAELLGEGTEIYLDASRGWRANGAMEVLRRTEGLGLSMLEEPCDAGEAIGRRRTSRWATRSTPRWEAWRP